jgi:hypothetical protein
MQAMGAAACRGRKQCRTAQCIRRNLRQRQHALPLLLPPALLLLRQLQEQHQQLVGLIEVPA